MRRLLSAALIASTMAFAACVHGPLLTTQATTPPVAGSAAKPPKFGDSIVYGGLRYVSHDSTMTGSGTISSPLSATASLSGGVTGDIVNWASPTTVGNYGGSSPSACSAGTAMTDLALSAAGVLTLTCGITPITGTLTNGDLLIANSTSSATAFGGSTCAGSTVATAIAASGGLTCGITPLTATNVSGTANDLAKFTATNTVGNSNFVDDGTTATLGTSKDTIAESTGGMLINDSGTPTDSQIRMQGTTRTTSGTMAMEVNDTDAMYIYFDAEKVGGSTIATGSTVAYLSKSGGNLYIAGSMSSTAGSAYTATNYDQLTLSTGFWEHKYAEKIDGNATLGNTDAALATVQGHLAGYNATAPTISSCGTSTLTTHSSDLDGKIVWDASSTACTLTFHTAFTNVPSCTLTYEDTNAKGYDAQWIHSAAASNIVIYQSSASGSTVNYHCVGMQQ